MVTKLPKDYANHENIIVFGLSFKGLAIALSSGSLAVLILRNSFINWALKIVLLIPLAIITLLLLFYKTQEGDDLFTYILNLMMYYGKNKFYVYKKDNLTERRQKLEQKDGRKNR